ncbi:MAG: ChaN family lipoprotein [Leptolyngbyaceae cyanobacterium]
MKLSRVWLSLTSVLLLLAHPTWAEVPTSITQPDRFPSSATTTHSPPVRPQLQMLAQANVVYLAETHDRPQDHQAQLQIIQALYQRRPDLVIGMEMFQQPYQPALDRYLAGQLTEAQLQAATQYQQRWGFPWEFYAPILRFAQAKQVPVVALNLPSEITRKVARTGLESLTAAERQAIPDDILKGPDSYRSRLLSLYQDSHQGHGNSAGFDRFFLAQVLWDETMADRIAELIKANPKQLVVVLVGQGHVNYGEGIPDRVARRLSSQLLKQVSVLLNPTQEQAQDQAIADYFWYFP